MSLTDQITSQLSGPQIQQISQQLGVDPGTAQSAVATALPLLLGALGRNASQPAGAQNLLGALQNDHAGAAGLDVGSLLGSILGGGQSRQTNGAGILGHIFGSQQQQAASGLGQVTGLGANQSNMLLQILAPIVMAYLARRMFGGGAQSATGTPNADALSGMLGQEAQHIGQQQGGAGGLLGAIFDRDGDGQVGLGDVLKMGGSILGGQRNG